MIYVAVIVALIVDIAFSVTFSSLAEEKGYYGKGYFWLCLLFGVIGFLYVAALPDLNAARRLNSVLGKLQEMQDSLDQLTGKKTSSGVHVPPAPPETTLGTSPKAKNGASASSSKKPFDPDSYPAGPM